MDTRTPAQRRKIMQSVGTKDTGPEWIVRRSLHRLGYRYRLHAEDLPGRPDIVFRSRKKAVFVHGCYWHGHGCSKGQPPKSNVDYWLPKLSANKDRDIRKEQALRILGWNVLTIWQCDVNDQDYLEKILKGFLGAGSHEV